ncbi:MAG: histidine kinase, partial [bacterium]|nr:histidine kinase [bacterium]
EDPDSLSENHVYSFCKDHNGNLWIGTRIGGVNLFSNTANQFRIYRKPRYDKNSLSNISVNCIYESRPGVLWIGTLKGLNRFDELNHRFTQYSHQPGNPNSLSHNEVRSIVEDQSGNFWVGTRGGGVNRFLEEEGKFISYRHNPAVPDSLSHDSVNQVYVDSSQRLWIGTMGGLNLYDRDNQRFIHYKNEEGNPSSLSDSMVRAIYEDAGGWLWIGTRNGGLNRFDPGTGTFVRYRNIPGDPTSLSHNFIMVIHPGKRGILWIGTSGGGLNRFDKANKRFTSFTEKDGLPDDSIYAIQKDDDGNLWLSTNKGLSRFNSRARVFTNYDNRDGLAGNEFNYNSSFKRKSGLLYFGGINGLSYFQPASIRKNRYKPPVVLTGFQVFNKPVPIGEQTGGRVILKKSISYAEALTLSYKDSVFSFQFTALNYVVPEKNQYSFIMQGFEEEWNNVGTRRFATYTNLPAGEYTFRVKGSNNDGIWNNIGSSLKITIEPPFWKRWWFLMGLILLTVSVAFLFYRHRIAGIERNKKELQMEV